MKTGLDKIYVALRNMLDIFIFFLFFGVGAVLHLIQIQFYISFVMHVASLSEHYISTRHGLK